MRLSGMLCPLLLVLACVDMSAQAVVSTHSGLLNFYEGTVLLDDQVVNQQTGTFASLKEGSTLRTEKGRSELLLTPGVFLRLDEHSAVRMVTSALSNTRVEFLQGGAILDSNQAASGNSVVLVYKSFQIRFPKSGVYRIDGEPGVFETYTGEAEILADGQPTKTIDESHQFFFSIAMDTKKYGDGAVDTFSEWARNRAETIMADDKAAAQSLVDPPDPPDPSNAPFGVAGAVPYPSIPGYSVPSYSVPGGIFGNSVYWDNGFYGPNNPYGSSLFPFNPITVIYVYPRLYANNPGGGTPPRKVGAYPILPPARSILPPAHSGYPRPTPWHPTPIPLRSTYIGPSAGRMTTPAPYRVAAPPRFAAPARVSAPAIAHPMAMPHR